MNKIVLFVLLSIMIRVNLSAQTDTSGWGRQSDYNRLYDVKTPIQFTGEITAIKEFTPLQGMSQGIHVLVKSGEDTISVQLGPKWFVDKQTVQLKTGDKVLVRGSQVEIREVEVVIAREIETDSGTLTLRDDEGVPMWAGGGMKRMGKAGGRGKQFNER